MAVAPASMADKIIVLDGDDEEESPHASCTASDLPTLRKNAHVSPKKAPQSAPTHSRSPLATSNKQTHVLQAENERLFAEFIEHCSAFTKECPEVLTFLQTKMAKASPDYLLSVEFRNTLGQCLTRAQGNRSKTFVYIRELCTVLKQHATKKRKLFAKIEQGSPTPAPSPLRSTSVTPKDETKGKQDEEGEKTTADGVQPSTSGLQEYTGTNKEEQQVAEKKATRASRKQIAYLENLLKVYNDEICRLQQVELSFDDLEAEDSTYIQEHKLKRKIMKIYEKLCELKDCNILTGRVIEQRIPYRTTRYPEINRRIERFINSAEAQRNPPDYQDILQQVLRANERHNLSLSRKLLNQLALDAFGETGTSMQERRQLDLVYNFGSHLTDSYKPASDPALSDPSLQRKLRSNREVALSKLDEVIAKYAIRQEDTEDQERSRRLEKDVKISEEGEKSKEVNGRVEKEENPEVEEDDDDDEEDDSSDPDIEEEIQASTQQDGPDDENEEDNSNEAEQAPGAANQEDPAEGSTGSPKEEEEEPFTIGLSPLSEDSKSQTSLSEISSPRDSPSQSEPTQAVDQRALSNGNLAAPEEPAKCLNQISDGLVTTSEAAEDREGPSPVVANGSPSPMSFAVGVDKSCTQTTNGTSPQPSPRATRSQKRKRGELTAEISQNTEHQSREVDIPLDMGAISCSSPAAIRADTPAQDLVSSSQSTPPPKKNKVNVATQCDPDEIIVLSDSE